MNVAIGLARLGRQTLLMTRLGDDDRGRSRLRHLAASGMRLAEESVLPVTTATALASLAPDGSASYEFNLRWELNAVSLPVAPLVIHTGSIAAVAEPGSAAVTQRLRASPRSGDHQLRPELPAVLVRHVVRDWA